MDYILPICTFSIAIVCTIAMFAVMKRDIRGVKASYAFLSLMYGLRIQPTEAFSPTPHPTAKGMYNGRELTIASGVRPVGIPRRAFTLITVAVPEIGKESCTVTPVFPGTALMARNRIMLKDEAFDARFIVEGSSALATKVLTAEVRKNILAAASNDFLGTYAFGNGQLTCDVLRLIHNDKRMRASEGVIATLYRIAEMFPHKK